MNFAEKYGPWAVISGASEGTGQAFVRNIASQGVNCILIARREGPLQELANEIREAGNVDCITASVDLSAADALDQITDAVGSREVGLYVANAGADTNSSTFLNRDIESWVSLTNLNIETLMRCCHHFGRQMRERGQGGMILVGSGACYGGASGMAVYSGAKAFVLCFAEGLWSELKPYGVEVLNLVLGRTDTPAFREFLAEKDLPVPSDLASPEDVAELGLARLPHGPIQNWGQEDDEAGFSSLSAADRRSRAVAISEATRDIFPDK